MSNAVYVLFGMLLCLFGGVWLGWWMRGGIYKPLLAQLAIPRMVEKSNLDKPMAGETWVFKPKSDDCPFPKDPPHKVRVLEVRDGWLRYRVGSLFPNEKLTIVEFTRMYAKDGGQ